MAIKGQIQSEEHIQRRIEARRKNGTYIMSEEQKERLRTLNIGRKKPEGWAEMMSSKLKGRVSPMKDKKQSPEFCQMLSELHKGNKYKLGIQTTEETKQKLRDRTKGESIKNWLGDFAGYDAMHRWVEREKGKPYKCEHCERTDKKKYEWANIDHSYKRNIDDYIRLCTSCHRKYDIQNNKKVA